MMGRLNDNQGQLFYSFCLADAVPDDHPIREIAAVLDLRWVYAELAPHYPKIARPSIDSVLMIRMLIVICSPFDRNDSFAWRFKLTSRSLC